MRALVALGLTGLALSACAPVQDSLAREAARAAVRPVLAARFPGVPLEPATDCIIDNATAPELQRLARGLTQPVGDPGTTALVVDIATRPASLNCLTTTGLAPFLR